MRRFIINRECRNHWVWLCLPCQWRFCGLMSRWMMAGVLWRRKSKSHKLCGPIENDSLFGWSGNKFRYWTPGHRSAPKPISFSSKNHWWTWKAFVIQLLRITFTGGSLLVFKIAFGDAIFTDRRLWEESLSESIICEHSSSRIVPGNEQDTADIRMR